MKLHEIRRDDDYDEDGPKHENADEAIVAIIAKVVGTPDADMDEWPLMSDGPGVYDDPFPHMYKSVFYSNGSLDIGKLVSNDDDSETSKALRAKLAKKGPTKIQKMIFEILTQVKKHFKGTSWVILWTTVASEPLGTLTRLKIRLSLTCQPRKRSSR